MDLGPPGGDHLGIENVHFPRGYRTAPMRDPIPVQVWLNFEPCGYIKGMQRIPEWVDGEAVQWTSTHVGVRTGDKRVCWDIVWVKAGDVRRR